MPNWSEAVGEADWIADRLSPFGECVTSVVPGAFEAYARVLHPAEDPLHGGDRVVRWAEVAAWSRVCLRGWPVWAAAAVAGSRRSLVAT